jgi:hypothetical protein
MEDKKSKEQLYQETLAKMLATQKENGEWVIQKIKF